MSNAMSKGVSRGSVELRCGQPKTYRRPNHESQLTEAKGNSKAAKLMVAENIR
jgi:hypothetical protein